MNALCHNVGKKLNKSVNKTVSQSETVNKTVNNIVNKSVNQPHKTAGHRDVGKFSIGRPSILGQLAAIGTDDPEAVHHFLSIMDVNTQQLSARDDPLVACIAVPEHISDVHWLDPEVLLTATGKGTLTMFSYDQEQHCLQHVGQ